MSDLTLFDPGRANDFFTLTRGTSFRTGARPFDHVNALWLAEISRLLYRRSDDEPHRHPGRSRKDFLSTAGMKEVAFFDDGKNQGSLIEGAGFRILAFRGTEPLRLKEDFLTDVKATPIKVDPFPGLVHQGFAEGINSLWPTIRAALKSNKAVPLYITGHSLGGALATLAMFRCEADQIQVAGTYTFGCPRVGTRDFHAGFANAIRIFRVVNDQDLVPRVPLFINGYLHIGTLGQIKHNGELQTDPSHEDGPELILLPVDELLDHVPLHYVQKLRSIVATNA
jgi:hypothetical protein